MMFGAFGTLMASRATAGANQSRDKPVNDSRQFGSHLQQNCVAWSTSSPAKHYRHRIRLLTLPRPFVDPQVRSDLLISLFGCEDYDGMQLSPTIQNLPGCASLRKFMKRWVVS